MWLLLACLFLLFCTFVQNMYNKHGQAEHKDEQQGYYNPNKDIEVAGASGVSGVAAYLPPFVHEGGAPLQ